MTQRIALALLCATLSLSACQTAAQTPGTPTVTQTQLQQRVVLGSALSKRVLPLRRINGEIQPVARLSVDTGFSIQQFQAEPLIAVAEPAIARPAVEPAIAPAYYYGGHDFNQYTIQYAEENRYGGNDATTLISTYKQTVEPILQEWADDARLIESRAQINSREAEFIHLPGQDGEPLKLKPDFVFRFASNSRKETLNIYAMKNETRAHRMVWGQPNIQIEKVRIDSDKALNIAREAFRSQSNRADYPIYPNREEGNQKVIYDLPEQLHWRIQLSQHHRDQLRYFLHFNFEQDIDLPTPHPVPLPEPLPVEELEAMLDDPNLSDEERAQLKEDFYARQEQTQELSLAPRRHYLSGSIEIDAVSGKILSMNRPVIYLPHHGFDHGIDEPGGGMSVPGNPGTAVSAPTVSATEVSSHRAEGDA